MFALFCFPFLGYSYDILQFRKLTVIQNPFLLKTHGTSMFHCAEHCYCLDACKSYNYDRKQKVCTIFNIVLTKDDLEDNDDFIYTEKDKIPSVSIKSLCFFCSSWQFEHFTLYRSVTIQYHYNFELLFFTDFNDYISILVIGGVGGKHFLKDWNTLNETKLPVLQNFKINQSICITFKSLNKNKGLD